MSTPWGNTIRSSGQLTVCFNIPGTPRACGPRSAAAAGPAANSKPLRRDAESWAVPQTGVEIYTVENTGPVLPVWDKTFVQKI